MDLLLYRYEALRQRRTGQITLESAEEGRSPLQSALAEALAGLHGLSWEAISGQVVRLAGADCRGVARRWGEKAFTARGLLPHLSLSFSAVGFFHSPLRHLVWVRLSEVIENAGSLFMTLSPSTYDSPIGKPGSGAWPGMAALNWHGQIEAFRPSGRLLHRADLQRQYSGLGWEDLAPGIGYRLQTELETWAPSLIVSGMVTGIGQTVGPLLAIGAMYGPDRRVEMRELYDQTEQNVFALRHWYLHEKVERVEVVAVQAH